jgi:hypothetical protein
LDEQEPDELNIEKKLLIKKTNDMILNGSVSLCQYPFLPMTFYQLAERQ